jgi:hypothetical protein
MSEEKETEYVSDRAKLLRKAEQIIQGNRDASYGTPEDSFRAIAQHWETYLQSRGFTLSSATGSGIERGLGPGDVAAMMILVKVARMETGGLGQTDSWLDIAGYAACGFETQHLDAP